MRVIDLRSDTVTHPTPEMRQAMAAAEVGDDVFGDDPTLNRLEETAARRLDKEAAVFVASGTMGNLVSILAHSRRGDEVILGDKSHIFRNEAGGASALGGVSYHTVRNDSRGLLDPDDVLWAIRSADIHEPNTAVVALENTHNLCGGSVLTPEQTKIIADVTHDRGIPLHIDGARIFNAAVALEAPVADLVHEADSVTFCLSKGLCCPIGSIVCGSQQFVDEARRWRKMVGGGMRQVGIVAAAGIVALETMVERLVEDHTNARKLALGLSEIPGISVCLESLPTNLVFFQVERDDRAGLARKLEERGIKGAVRQPLWRYVTHYGITSDDIDYALDIIESTFRETAS
ncbi:low-specificity L-threonine aldolase [Dehalococcoidia bacterium]|nr:low-specificity L-threonine aldolase [Dehalococcoidia bacterium]